MAADAAENAAVDLGFQPGDRQFHTGRGRLGGAAVGVEGNAGHQGAVDEVQPRQCVAGGVGHFQRRAGDEQAVERAGGVGGAGHAQPAQIEHRSAAVGGANLDRTIGYHVDVQGFAVAAAVGDLDHAVAGNRGERGGQRGVVVGHAYQRDTGWRQRQRGAALVFAAADVGREALAPSEAHIGRVGRVGGQGNAAEHRVNRVDAIRRRGVGPAAGLVAEVADVDVVALDDGAVHLQNQRRVGVVQRRAGAGALAVVAGQMRGEATARQRPGYVVRLGQMGDVVFGQRAVVERQVVIQGAGAVTAHAGAGGGRLAVRVGLDAPQVQADIGDVVPATAGLDVTHIHRAVGGFEGGADPFERLGAAQVGGVQIGRAQVVHVLRGAQALEVFDRAGVPAGDIARQLFEHQRRALASAQGNGVRHFGARAGGLGRGLVQAAVADEVADVGHRPLGAGLDEQIVVELFQALVGHGQLLGEHADELFQRAAIQPLGSGQLGVADAVDGRQQLEQFLRVGTHGSTSSSIGSVARVSSSAACGTPVSEATGSAANRRGTTTVGLWPTR